MASTRIIAAVAVGLLGLAPAVGRADEPAITEVPVAFTVQNLNRSAAPCPADGRTYTVRGSLVLPAGGVPDTVTLYVQGSGNARSWHFTAVPGYDYANAMAALGHASVVIDNLGYGDSDIPPGDQVCIGSLADVDTQIGTQLRTGTYTASGEPGPAFARVALAGHSGGAVVAHVIGYSFPGAFDAIVLAGFVDALTPQITAAGLATQSTVFGALVRSVALRCLPGEPKRAGASGGYAYGFDDRDIRGGLFANAEPTVVDAFAVAYERDACGALQSGGTAIATSLALSGLVTAPVLILLGEYDVASATGGEVQRAQFTGSNDVSLEIVARTGHMLWLERAAPAVRGVLHQWLSDRGF